MFARNESDKRIREQAAEWTTRLDSGEMSDAELEAFHAWLEDPRHARELTIYRAMLSVTQDFGTAHKATLSQTLAHSEAKLGALKSLFTQPLWLSGVAASTIAVVVLGGWFGLRPVREFITQTYTTEVGELRVVRLKDGTVAHLNTASSLTWVGSGNDRHVVLKQGEVFFEVVHDVARPFRITVDNSEIRDIGTQFDVYRKTSGSVVVTVLSGEVAVKEITAAGIQSPWAERQLHPNEQLEYTPSSLLADVHSTVAPKAVRWREGLLETEGQSFATIVTELNRYSTKQIRLPEQPQKFDNIKFGGTLSIHDVPALLKRIQTLQPIVVTDTGDSYILSLKTDAPAPELSNAGRP